MAPATQGGLVSLARYRRTVSASLARVWENVLDWEHLPWLHRSSFAGIEPIDAGDRGWRARVELAGAGAPHGLVIEVALEREALRYVTRTLEGAGAGSEIWTRLEPAAERETRIEVEFRLPGVSESAAPALGAAYVALYTRLWDEDEAMMRRRQDFLDGSLGRVGAGAARPGDGPWTLRLGSPEALRARLPLVLEAGGRRWRIVEIEGRFLAHAALCPHLGGPLEEVAVEGGVVTCPWHGYRFDLASGRSCDGRALALATPPRVRLDAATRELRLELA